MLALALLLALGPTTEATLSIEAVDDAAQHRQRVFEAVRDGLARGGVTTTEAADATIVAKVAADGADTKLRIEARSNGKLLAETEGVCEICGTSELVALAADLSGRLAERLAAMTDTGTLRIGGEPEGADVFLDGERVGETPMELEIVGGDHVVEIKAPGYGAAGYEWTAVPGVSEVFRYALREEQTPRDDPGVSPPTRRAMRIAGWATLGAGIVGGAAGGVLFAIDGNPFRATCPAESIDVNGLCPESFVTKTAGIVGIALGAASLAASVPLLVIGHGDREQVSIGIRPGGLFVRGRF